jgi:hypothetical protein
MCNAIHVHELDALTRTMFSDPNKSHSYVGIYLKNLFGHFEA